MKWKKEFEELKDLWSKSSWFIRILLIFSFFLSVSSIASLSDKIFAWKGFILDGVTFYRSAIRSKIISLFDWLNLSILEGYEDIFVIYMLIGGAVVRYLRFRSVRIIENKSIVIIVSRKKTRMKFFIAYLIIYVFGMFCFAGFIFTITPWMFLIVFSIFILAFSLIFISGNDYSELLALNLPIFMSILIVLILGAIYTGLSK